MAPAALLGIAAVLYLGGVRRELPFYYEGDERIFVQLAVRMAVSEDPNPRWFGNPGSTLLYPLALFYRLADVVGGGAPVLGPDRPLLERFRADPGPFYLAGRILNVAYALGGLLLVWLIGRRAFGERSALGGVLLALLCPLTMTHAQLVRTDAAGLFFAMLALLACLRVLEQPSPRRHLAAGAAIGLALASRYFLGALLAPLLAASLPAFRRARAEAKPALLAPILGLLAVPLAFAAASPYFFLDWQTALLSLRGEARSSHPGADGLTPASNFLFYTGDVIPGQLGLPLALLAGLGVARVTVQRALGPRLLALFVATFVFGICLSPLHWPRWTIPVLPLLALFAAAALEASLAQAGSRLRRPGIVFSVALLALSLFPALRFTREALRAWRPTTRLLARAWLIEHLPAGAKLVAERGSAPLVARQQALDEQLAADGLLLEVPLDGRSVKALLVPSLPTRGPLEDYLREGYRYAVTATYERELLPQETRFYEELSARARALARFDPGPTRAGPAIRVWELPEREAASPR